jgi:hypothetical protein
MTTTENLKELIDENKFDVFFATAEKYSGRMQNKVYFYRLRNEYLDGIRNQTVMDFCDRLKVFVESEKEAFDLPDTPSKTKEKVLIAPDEYKETFEHNQKLYDTIVIGLKNQKITSWYAELEQDKLSSNEFIANILSLFPSPVSNKLKALFAPALTDDKGVQKSDEDILGERFENLTDLAEILFFLLAAIALSDLWNKVIDGKISKLTPSCAALIEKYLCLQSEDDFNNFSFFELFLEIFLLNKQNRLQFFLNNLPEPDENVLKSAYYFDELKSWLFDDKITNENLETFCRQTEEHLVKILHYSQGFIDFMLFSVREIRIEKLRFKLPHIKFSKFSLIGDNNGRPKDETDDIEISENKFETVEHSSVIISMSKNAHSFSPYLILSPLVIDYSEIYGGTTSNVFFFMFVSEKIKGYHFKSALYGRDDKPKIIEEPKANLPTGLSSLFARPEPKKNPPTESEIKVKQKEAQIVEQLKQLRSDFTKMIKR